MKWFKHENTFNNPKIEVLTELWGIEGYGVYFSLLELIASHIETDNQDAWGYMPEEYGSRYLAKKLHIAEDKLDNIILECIRLKLFEDHEGKIFCPKILERCDDYTQRLVKQSTTNSEQTTKKVEKSSSRIRTEEDKNKKENKNITTNVVATAVAETGLNPIINLFKGVNPDFDTLFENITERKALQSLIDKYSREKIQNLLQQLPEIVAKPYAPIITKPKELQSKKKTEERSGGKGGRCGGAACK